MSSIGQTDRGMRAWWCGDGTVPVEAVMFHGGKDLPQGIRMQLHFTGNRKRRTAFLQHDVGGSCQH